MFKTEIAERNETFCAEYAALLTQLSRFSRLVQERGFYIVFTVELIYPSLI
jgi:hypothetical protein